MQQLNFYDQLLENEKQRNPQAAEYLEEEIDILIHKLKYIHQDIRPTVLILQQATDFSPLYNEQLHDIIAIAGGVSIADKMDNPSIICIVQEDESLLSTIFSVLQDDVLSRSNAVQKKIRYTSFRKKTLQPKIVTS